MTQLDIPAATARLADLIAAAAAGEEVIIADAAGRRARLVAVEPIPQADANPRDRVLGSFAGQVWMSDDFDAPLNDAELEDLGL